MRVISLVVFGFALFVMVFVSATVGAQEATAVALPLVPDPAACEVAHRSIAGMQDVLATPIAAPSTAPFAATPFTEPAGSPADAETGAAEIDTALQIVACSNAGDFLALSALYTDGYLRLQFG